MTWKNTIQISVLAMTIAFCPGLKAQTVLEEVFPGFYKSQWNHYTFATSGGLNNPQFSNADLNNDGVQDLVIFDRTGGAVQTFIYKGPGNYTEWEYQPKYAKNFPRKTNFMLMRDFNCDGIADMFNWTQTSLGAVGIEVSKGSYNSDNELEFTLFSSLLTYPGFMGQPQNLFVSNIDIPAIDDIDGDSDMDILTFNIGGGYVEYYENKSNENGYGCDSLIFELEDACWGRFYESGLTSTLSLSSRIDSCSESRSGDRHAGSTLMTYDADNDGDKEIVLGDIFFTKLVEAQNCGHADTAFMCRQDIEFPSYSVPTDIIIFPAAFHVDINNDGNRDLITAPNDINVSTNDEVAWMYQNANLDLEPDFQFNTKSFLVNEMVDLGSGFAPTFFDYNADGLIDMIAGHFGYYNSGGNFATGLTLFENTGTATEPVFMQVDNDFGSLRGLGINALHPTSGDLDGDGDVDMLIGEADGKLVYLENTAGSGNTAVWANPQYFWQNIDPGRFSTPFLADLNRDGKLDLAIGERNGEVNYYQNTGTATAPQFDSNLSANGIAIPTTETLGNVTGDNPLTNYGYSTPCFYDDAGSWKLYLGTGYGNIRYYDDIEGNLTGNFNLVEEKFADIFVGIRTTVGVIDINADGDRDYFVGNFRGGFSVFSASPFATNVSEPAPSEEILVTISPNPATDVIHVTLNNQQAAIQGYLFNALGQLVEKWEMTEQTNLDVGNFPRGVYFVRLQGGNIETTRKVILR